jgi:hypothetical protein
MLALSAAVPAGLAVSAAIPAGAADLTKIRIATVNSETSGAAMYAQDKGFFTQAGLEADLAFFQSGAVAASTRCALRAGHHASDGYGQFQGARQRHVVHEARSRTCARMVRDEQGTVLSPELLQPNLDVLARYNALPNPVTVGQLVWNPR